MTLVFPCSGTADVGEISDRVGRKMTKEGLGRMYCLAGIGGHVSGIVESTKAATEIITIDGCPVACATKALEHAGFRPRAMSLKEMGFTSVELKYRHSTNEKLKGMYRFLHYALKAGSKVLPLRSFHTHFMMFSQR